MFGCLDQQEMLSVNQISLQTQMLVVLMGSTYYQTHFQLQKHISCGSVRSMLQLPPAAFWFVHQRSS